MKIDVYTLCKNEIELAKFYIDYWKALADEVEVYVYDEISDDGTLEELQKHDWIHVIPNKVPDGLNDTDHKNLQNECWKQSRSKADFVMVSDFDETLFSDNVHLLHDEIQFMKDSDCTICRPINFSPISKDNVFPEYEEGKFLHELCSTGFRDREWEEKTILFDPNKIDEINYVEGKHVCRPTGEVKWYNGNKLYLIHGKYVTFDYYLNRISKRHISRYNMTHNMCGEKDKSEQQKEREFQSKLNSCFDFAEYQKKPLDRNFINRF